VRRQGFDVIEAKLRPPPLRPGVVPRGALVSRLRRDSAAAVTLVARAGYGKTTLLAQWAAAESRPVAWLSLDARDNDPVVLLHDLVAAVDRAQPLDARLFAALGAGRKPRLPSIVGRTAEAFASCRKPFLLVVDNAELLSAPAARRVFSILVGGLPRGSTLALGSRSAPRLAAGALRTGGGLRELGVEELALSRREALLLLQAASPGLTEREATDVITRCEGWPAALYLASLSDGEPAGLDRSGFGGDDRYFAEYFRAEYLPDLRPQDIRFLRRMSMLRELTGPLCDAVLQEGDSARRLERLADAQLVVTPLERKHDWYRFHRLLREFFQRELVDLEPQAIRALHRRAADWYELTGDPTSALEHADAAGDPDRVAALITASALPVTSRGRVEDIERRLARFAESWPLERYPPVALHGSWIHAFRGRADEAQRWLEIAERGLRRGGRDAEALHVRIHVLRAALCRYGARRMVADAGAALARLPRSSDWYPAALHMRGCAAMLLGADNEADELLAEAARAADAQRCPERKMLAVAQRSFIALRRGDLDGAGALSAQASEILLQAELKTYPTSALVLAAAARTALRHGRWAEARELVSAAEPLRSSLTEALPWLAAETRLELAHCYVTLRDGEAAREVVAELDALLEARPRLGVLVERVRELAGDVETLTLPERGVPTSLTPAELRLLPLLATHLSFREIAEQLQVSRNTVKTQAISIYRKLGVTGRSDAISVAGSMKVA
jgi:LuxR family transcriptional regulator, maltose regulon positive regulatory protein